MRYNTSTMIMCNVDGHKLPRSTLLGIACLTPSYDALSKFFLPIRTTHRQKTRKKGRKNSDLYSNINCTPIKIQEQETNINLRPSKVPKSCVRKNLIPSVPTTNPTRLAIIIMSILKTAPMAQTCRYQGNLPYYRYV